MPIDVIERGPDGAYVTVPDPGAAPASVPVVPQEQNGTTAETAPGSTPGAQGESAPPPEDAPPPDAASLAASPPEGEDADVADDAATVPFVNRRIKQLNAKRRETEKLLAEERQQNAQRQAQLEARIDTLTRVVSGAAPDVPASPPQPTGPPQAEQFSSTEEWVRAEANYAAESRFQQQRQLEAQAAFQRSLIAREQAFVSEHPDFHRVVQGALAGKLSPVLQQALMLVPDGPAVAYTLAQQPELVRQLNSLPPPLVLVELGRLSPASPQQPSPTPAAGSANGHTPPTTPAPQAPLPEPMAPVGGGGSMAQPTFNENMSQSEYERWRAKTSNLPYLRRG